MAPQAADPFDHRRLSELFARAEQEVDRGRLPSCQLAVGRGPAIVTAAFGSATADSRYVLFSLTKTLVAGAVWALISDGLLRAGTFVADVIPEFAANGKQEVTVEHLLTHTAGFPNADVELEATRTSDARAAAFSQWRLEFTPGSRFSYHGMSAHWVLAEIIERVTGSDYRGFIAERVVAPLRLEGLQLGVPVAQQDDILEVQVAGVGADPEAPGALAALLGMNAPEARAAGVPGVGAVASAMHVARYFQFLLHGAPHVWDTGVLTDATRTIRCSLVNPETGVAANRCLGLTVAGDDGNAVLRGFGRAVGPRTFGHTGAGGQIVWADPDSGLSYCFLTNGIDADEAAVFERSAALSTLASRCATAD